MIAWRISRKKFKLYFQLNKITMSSSFLRSVEFWRFFRLWRSFFPAVNNLFRPCFLLTHVASWNLSPGISYSPSIVPFLYASLVTELDFLCEGRSCYMCVLHKKIPESPQRTKMLSWSLRWRKNVVWDYCKHTSTTMCRWTSLSSEDQNWRYNIIIPQRQKVVSVYANMVSCFIIIIWKGFHVWTSLSPSSPQAIHQYIFLPTPSVIFFLAEEFIYLCWR